MGFLKKINSPIVLNVIGILMMMNGLFMSMSLVIELIYQEGLMNAWIISSVSTFVIGFLIYYKTKNAPKVITNREGYLVVGLGWVILTLTGTIPYVISKSFLEQAVVEANNFGIINMFFESVSGYTTTGATLLNDIEIVPHSLLFWRSLTHWIGGMGIIVLTIAILPFLGIGGMQLFIAETPGITADKLHPRITDTAKRLWLIYFIFTVTQMLLLYFAGMDWFDAINHAFSSMATGGFSTKNESVGFWNNMPLIQYIIVVFMFLGGTNFVLNYYLLKFNFKKILKNEEFRFYLGILLVAVSILTFLVYQYGNPSLSNFNHQNDTITSHGVDSYSLESSFRYSIFQALAIITTTGFVVSDYTSWHPLAGMIFFAFMFLGACAGSTSGGVKIIRHVLLIKNGWQEFKRILQPNAIIPVQINQKAVSQKIVYQVLAFFMIYMLIFIFGSIIMSFLINDSVPSDKMLISSITVTASSLGNIGPAFGYFSPVDNFGALSDVGKLFSSFLMIIGRLELFTILIILTPAFWKK